MTDTDTTWQAAGACRGVTSDGDLALVWVWSDPREIDPDENRRNLALDTMATMCRLDCPVRLECLDHALSHGELWGMWGGLFDRQLAAARRMFRAGATAAEAFDAIAPKALI